MQMDAFSVAVGRAAFRRRLPNAIPRAETVFLSTFAHGNFPNRAQLGWMRRKNRANNSVVQLLKTSTILCRLYNSSTYFE